MSMAELEDKQLMKSLLEEELASNESASTSNILEIEDTNLTENILGACSLVYDECRVPVTNSNPLILGALRDDVCFSDGGGITTYYWMSQIKVNFIKSDTLAYTLLPDDPTATFSFAGVAPTHLTSSPYTYTFTVTGTAATAAAARLKAVASTTVTGSLAGYADGSENISHSGTTGTTQFLRYTAPSTRTITMQKSSTTYWAAGVRIRFRDSHTNRYVTDISHVPQRGYYYSNFNLINRGIDPSTSAFTFSYVGSSQSLVVYDSITESTRSCTLVWTHGYKNPSVENFRASGNTGYSTFTEAISPIKSWGIKDSTLQPLDFRVRFRYSTPSSYTANDGTTGNYLENGIIASINHFDGSCDTQILTSTRMTLYGPSNPTTEMIYNELDNRGFKGGIVDVYYQNCPIIEQDLCTKCGNCSDVCPSGAIEYNPDTEQFEINYDKCYVCGLCVNECYDNAVGAISLASASSNHIYVTPSYKIIRNQDINAIWPDWMVSPPEISRCLEWNTLANNPYYSEIMTIPSSSFQYGQLLRGSDIWKIVYEGSQANARAMLKAKGPDNVSVNVYVNGDFYDNFLYLTNELQTMTIEMDDDYAIIDLYLMRRGSIVTTYSAELWYDEILIYDAFSWDGGLSNELYCHIDLSRGPSDDDNYYLGVYVGDTNNHMLVTTVNYRWGYECGFDVPLPQGSQDIEIVGSEVGSIFIQGALLFETIGVNITTGSISRN